MITTQSIVDAPIINTFGLPEATVSPSDQLITLTLGHLQDLVRQAIERATTPLTARLDAMEERGVGSGEGGEEDLQDLKGRLEDLEEATARERAYDRQRIAKLERVDPQPLQKDRGGILRALIAANGGKMLAKDARQKMHLSRSQFSVLLSTMSEYIETRPYHLNKSAKILMLKCV